MNRRTAVAITVAILAFVQACAGSGGKPASQPPPAPEQRQPQSEVEAARQARERGEPFIPKAFLREVASIECDDGYRLSAELLRRRSSSRRMPGVIMIHDLGGNRMSWYPLTIQMAARGYAVLTLDLRGHGENPSTLGNPERTYKNLTPEDYLAMPSDIRNAIGHLAAKPDVDGGRIALIGSGLGANLALITAHQSWADAVRCVIAISPGPDEHGLKTEEAVLASSAGRAVLLAASKADAPSYSTASRLMGLLKEPRELVAQEGDAHGLKLLRTQLFTRIPGWIIQNLPPGPSPSGTER